MIKLIATDVDGTLVKESSSEIYPEIMDTIQSLKEKGVIIAIASGRQYTSIARLFEPIANDLIFIAENGAHIKCRGTDMNVVSMDQEMARELIEDLRKIPNVELVASTPQACYLESTDDEFINLITYGYRNQVKVVEDVLAEDITIIKVAAYRKGSIREIGENILIPKWKEKCKTCMSGEDWIDFMDIGVDKGNALNILQKFFHITSEETMVFGDNANDIGLLKAAGASYAVSTAREEVKKYAKHICGSYRDKGVYTILKRLDDSMKSQKGE
jgi:Cof subfamily protein (haloacid dehalogenase superfamily)